MGRRRCFPPTMSVLAVFMLGACRQEPVALKLPVNDDAPVMTDRARYAPEVFDDYVAGLLSLCDTSAICPHLPTHPRTGNLSLFKITEALCYETKNFN